MIIKFIDCTEKHHTEIDDITNFLSSYFDSLNIKNYKIKLKDMKIVRCTQCRICSCKTGIEPVNCFVHDEMDKAIEEIEKADAFVILADRNSLFSKNKIHEKFSQRLVAYYYWPQGEGHASPRRISLDKKSILINYNTTKYFMNHTFYTSKVNMTHTSTAIGAQVIDWLAVTPKNNSLSSYYSHSLIKMAQNLIHSLSTKDLVLRD